MRSSRAASSMSIACDRVVNCIEAARSDTNEVTTDQSQAQRAGLTTLSSPLRLGLIRSDCEAVSIEMLRFVVCEISYSERA